MGNNNNNYIEGSKWCLGKDNIENITKYMIVRRGYEDNIYYFKTFRDKTDEKDKENIEFFIDKEIIYKEIREVIKNYREGYHNSSIWNMFQNDISRVVFAIIINLLEICSGKSIYDLIKNSFYDIMNSFKHINGDVIFGINTHSDRCDHQYRIVLKYKGKDRKRKLVDIIIEQTEQYKEILNNDNLYNKTRPEFLKHHDLIFFPMKQIFQKNLNFEGICDREKIFDFIEDFFSDENYCRISLTSNN